MPAYRTALATIIFLGFSAFSFTQPLSAQTAGLLTGGAEKLPPITLSVVKPLAEAPYTLKSGVYYKLSIISDGSGFSETSGSTKS